MAWGLVKLVLTCWWAGNPPDTKASGRILMHQHQCPHVWRNSPKRLLPASNISSEGFPGGSCLSKRLSSVWVSLLLIYCLCVGTQCTCDFCSLLQSLFLQPSLSPICQPQSWMLAFKVGCSEGLSSCCEAPRLWSPVWGLNSLIFGENLCNCDYSPVCGLPAKGIWILTYCLFNPPTYLIVVTSYTF